MVLVERNDALHWVFAFPRFSVLEGYEGMGFVGYEDGVKGRGSVERVRGEVLRGGVEEGVVRVGMEGERGGERVVEWEYLVVATGCEQPVPARLRSRDTEEACEELRTMQRRIKMAEKVAVVGGGAVGTELAADIADTYPMKEVVLVHSREKLLTAFGERLHAYAMERFDQLGVRVVLGQRPVISEERVEGKLQSLTFSDGRVEEFDLIVSIDPIPWAGFADLKQVPCTGQRPNSSLLQDLAPESISKQTGHILVNETLQICDPDGQTSHPRVFALGDVADTGGPKMARAAMMQGEVVVDNILGMIKTRKAKATYRPKFDLEGSIKLTLGIVGGGHCRTRRKC